MMKWSGYGRSLSGEVSRSNISIQLPKGFVQGSRAVQTLIPGLCRTLTFTLSSAMWGKARHLSKEVRLTEDIGSSPYLSPHPGERLSTQKAACQPDPQPQTTPTYVAQARLLLSSGIWVSPKAKACGLHYGQA